MERFIKIYKIFLISIGIAIFCCIISSYFSFNGNLTVSNNFCSKSSIISEITPTGRALDIEKNTKTGECYQRMTGEPAYINAVLPRSYNQAVVTLNYKNPSQNIVELGVLQSVTGAAELKPFENKFLDNCTWEKISSDKIILYQKVRNYNSVEEFINNPSLDKNIATYNYSLNYNYHMQGYQMFNEATEYNQSIRGRHELFTYLENENLDFTFYWQDMNSATADNYIIKIYKGETEIHSAWSATELNSINEKNIVLTGLSGGVYRIVLDVSDDIVTTKMKSQQHYLVFKNKLYLYDASSLMPEIVSNNDELIIKTDYENGLQSIKISEDTIKLNKISTYFTWRPQKNTIGSVYSIQPEKKNFIMQGSGFFALNKDNFFDPDYNIDRMKNSMDIEQYDYLIAANYTGPLLQTGWKNNSATFDLSKVSGDRKNLFFVISSPGLSEAKEDIIIKNVTIKLAREPLTLKNVFNKIFLIFK